MKKYIVLVLFLFLNTIAFASPWVTNRDHSEIQFQVPYMGVSELTGRFNEFAGEVDLAADKKTASSLSVQISSSSIDTGNKMRDGHLKGSDFFESQQHPYISFKSSKITMTKPNTYKAIGELTIKGIIKPATIDFTTTDSLKDTWGYENKFVKFKSTLNRKDYKITWNKTLDGKQLLVGDTITFWGTFQMQPATGKTPNSKHMIPDTDIIRSRDEKRMKNEAVEESFISKKLKALINGK